VRRDLDDDVEVVRNVTAGGNGVESHAAILGAGNNRA
jgi:hypothetical protein